MSGKIVVKSCPFGLGVFASQFIGKGETILVFDGFQVEADDPLNRGDLQSYLIQTDSRRYVFPDPPGKYVNHSCRPNSGLREGMVLTALEDIQPGEEVFFDYSTTIEGDPWTMACRCGSPDCRGVVGEFRNLPAILQKTYAELGVVAPFIAKSVANAGSHFGLATPFERGLVE